LDDKMNIADLINGCDAKMQRHGIGALTAEERTISLVSAVNYELELGDLGSYFHNSASVHAAKTVEALLAIGATREASVIQKARELLRANSWEVLAASGAFEPLTAQFRSGDQDLFSRLAQYVEAHVAELGVVQLAVQRDGPASGRSAR
jgi:hypothetical protein